MTMPSFRSSIFSFIALGTIVACGQEPRNDETDSAAAAAASTALPPSTEGLRTPESVRYDPVLDVYFVSNIDGNPNNKDNNGYIVRLDAANPSTPTTIVQGGQNSVELHAPKGLAISGDTLWVADIDHLRAFDKNSGAAITSIALPGATFLNDVVVAPDGTIYVTDTGISFSATGEVSHPGKDRIYAVKGGVPSVAYESPVLAGPNGIAWDANNSRFVLATFGEANQILGWAPGESTVANLAAGPGGFDGIEVLSDGRILVTSWNDSSLSVITNGQLTKVAGGMDGPADIGIDTQRNRVAIPRFTAGKVDYVAIPPR